MTASSDLLNPTAFLFAPTHPRTPYSEGVVELLQALGEFIGTWFFVYTGLAGVNAALSVTATASLDPAAVLSIACAFGFGLAINVSLWYRVSGGSLNPAVTLGLVLIGKLNVRKAALYIVAEVLGGVVAAAFVNALYPGGVIGVNKRADGLSVAQAVFIEAFGTFLLISTVFLTAVEKSRITFLAPVLIGLVVFVLHLILIPYTGCSVNPARSFGPAVVTGDWKDQWIFWIGPVLGAVFASVHYYFITKINYRVFNPDQDSDGLDLVAKSHLANGDAKKAHVASMPSLGANASCETVV
ncbi:aquaporin-like protein [Gonapodya prolifera JEL478]|uniref:Aquaporin-like protein n=1 Tax=Gonapodya prolifera (strain JEL478) TaxID=1344416 RepID=A0A139A9C3_GONPJ|nr:aquaporin-like protein [Gonapodya prolifera JEL478]|eukprot:KXS13347.1 aquaporin-like protein [Gonapodya prolifera JEL478]